MGCTQPKAKPKPQNQAGPDNQLPPAGPPVEESKIKKISSEE